MFLKPHVWLWHPPRAILTPRRAVTTGPHWHVSVLCFRLSTGLGTRLPGALWWTVLYPSPLATVSLNCRPSWYCDIRPCYLMQIDMVLVSICLSLMPNGHACAFFWWDSKELRLLLVVYFPLLPTVSLNCQLSTFTLGHCWSEMVLVCLVFSWCRMVMPVPSSGWIAANLNCFWSFACNVSIRSYAHMRLPSVLEFISCIVHGESHIDRYHMKTPTHGKDFCPIKNWRRNLSRNLISEMCNKVWSERRRR